MKSLSVVGVGQDSRRQLSFRSSSFCVVGGARVQDAHERLVAEDKVVEERHAELPADLDRVAGKGDVVRARTRGSTGG